ncbi:endolysin [Phage f2b1]|nr:endolysin [Phage f2b1]
MVAIKQMLVSASLAADVTYSGWNPCNYIIVHETDNENKGANANAHARLQANGNSRAASWHYTVDENGAYQSFDDRKQCWAAGSKKYNLQAISIEICVNSDGDYKKAVENAAELVKILMERHNIPKSHVITHHESSGWKNCPRHLRDADRGVSWKGFVGLLDGKVVTPTVTVKPAPTETKSETTTAVTGGSKYIRAAQLFANGSGYPTKAKFSPITVDGYTGPKTRDALTRILQYLGGTGIDGIWGAKTAASVQLVRRGTKSASWVCLVQSLLNTKGASLAVDGVFGTGTEQALKGFQTSHGLSADGIAGKDTFKALLS